MHRLSTDIQITTQLHARGCFTLILVILIVEDPTVTEK